MPTSVAASRAYPFDDSSHGVTEALWAEWCAPVLTDGVLLDVASELSASAVPRVGVGAPQIVDVTIQPGAANVEGVRGVWTSPVVVQLAAPIAGPRTDRLVVSVDYSTNEVRLDVVAGSVGGGVPPIAQVAGVLWQERLHQWNVFSFVDGFGHYTTFATPVDERRFARHPSTRIGAITAWAGVAAPDNAHMLCRGQVLSRAEHPELFAVLGTAFNATAVGATPSGTEFAIPMLAGSWPAGIDPGGAMGIGPTPRPEAIGDQTTLTGTTSTYNNAKFQAVGVNWLVRVR